MELLWNDDIKERTTTLVNLGVNFKQKYFTTDDYLLMLPNELLCGSCVYGLTIRKNDSTPPNYMIGVSVFYNTLNNEHSKKQNDPIYIGVKTPKYTDKAINKRYKNGFENLHMIKEYPNIGMALYEILLMILNDEKFRFELEYINRMLDNFYRTKSS